MVDLLPCDQPARVVRAVTVQHTIHNCAQKHYAIVTASHAMVDLLNLFAQPKIDFLKYRQGQTRRALDLLNPSRL